MTDRHERELSLEEETRVAALLAEAGGPVTVPAEVADRLDGVLARLVEERAGRQGAQAAEPAGAEVTPLRRRRRGPVLLLAAAAVVAGGFAVPSLLDDEAPVTRSTAREGAREDGPAEGAAGAGGEPPEPELSSGAAGSAGPAGGALRTMPDRDVRLVPALGPVVLRPERLEEDVLDALRAGQRLDVVPDPDSSAATGAVCPEPPLGPGESWSPAEYAGTPAVLVAGPEQAGSVEAVVRSCAGEQLDETTVAVP